MELADWVVLVCLLMACGTASVFAQRQELNEKCKHYTDCAQVGYFCSSNRTCQCLHGYRPNRYWTTCVGIIGSKCIYDSHCIDGAFCTGPEGREVCRCKLQDDFFPSEDNTFCFNSATASGPGLWTVGFALAAFWTSGLYLNT